MFIKLAVELQEFEQCEWRGLGDNVRVPGGLGTVQFLTFTESPASRRCKIFRITDTLKIRRKLPAFDICS
jgi:hypothetical protein